MGHFISPHAHFVHKLELAYPWIAPRPGTPIAGSSIMEIMRSFIKWLSHHRWVSSISFLAGIIFFAALRVFVIETTGQLSAPLRRGTVIDAVYGIGTVTAARSLTIKPGIIASVGTIYAKEGDFLRKGDKILTLDRVLYKAPFDGVLNSLPYKPGENVFPPPLPVAAFTDLLTRYIVVSMQQQGALRVKPKQKAFLSFDSIRNKSYEGVVESVYSYNSNFLARIDLSTLPPEIMPDMTADVAIVIREIPNALLLPINALEGDSVWIKKSFGFPKKVKVKLGVVDQAAGEVLEGDLSEGDQLIIHPKVGS